MDKKKKLLSSPSMSIFMDVPENLNEATASVAQTQTPTPTPPPAAQVPTPSPVRYKRMPEEVKTRRVQIVLQPGLYDRAKEQANRQGMSFNEFIHHLLRQSLS